MITDLVRAVVVSSIQAAVLETDTANFKSHSSETMRQTRPTM
jgi:hypothetical protein